jgi:hypothetical protein
VPVVGLGMTGGEHALQLLRQSWVSRPLTLAKDSKLQAITSASDHTPALLLTCARTHAASASLTFLYGTASESHEDWLHENLPHKAAVLHAYSQNLRRPDVFPVVCSRSVLAQEEAEGLMPVHARSRASNSQNHVIVPHEVLWCHLQKLKSWSACAGFGESDPNEAVEHALGEVTKIMQPTDTQPLSHATHKSKLMNAFLRDLATLWHTPHST